MYENNILTSGFFFDESQLEQKNRYILLNVILLLAIISGAIGTSLNFYLSGINLYFILDGLIFLTSIALFRFLRIHQDYFDVISNIVLAMFGLFFVFTIYSSEPSEMKHVWLFVYPIIVLSLKQKRDAQIILGITLSLVMIAPFQPFKASQYDFIQVLYVTVVMSVLSVIIHYYQAKMMEAKEKILSQKHQLSNFNDELSFQVDKKTKELKELNDSLEELVHAKVEELVEKDKILTVQSKQAVMGEMISMIAHQWRQPLSTMTLEISNLKFKRIMDQDLSDEDIDTTLTQISDTIMYLSETVDDFQTYFRPDKELDSVDIFEVIERSLSFIEPRLKAKEISIDVNKTLAPLYSKVYLNELIHVVLNILNNAVDAFEDNNSIDNPFIEIDVVEEREYITLIVLDNAGGIAEQNLYHIFEPYYSTKGKNGTGLGLYMSQMIIEKQFAGTITAQNYRGGALFSIRIKKEP